MVAHLCCDLEWCQLHWQSSYPGTTALHPNWWLWLWSMPCPLWLQHALSPESCDISITAKDLVPNVFNWAVWGSLPTRTHVEFQCDNLSLVEAIKKSSSKHVIVMHLLKCLPGYIWHLHSCITHSRSAELWFRYVIKQSTNQIPTVLSKFITIINTYPINTDTNSIAKTAWQDFPRIPLLF